MNINVTLSPELAGHMRMCIRMKLKKDRREFDKKESDGLFIPEGLRDRIERGEESLKLLKNGDDDDDDENS